ncbi:recombinase family protein [Brevibacillus sp. 179-C9.3 HS]|uniref:recombinase family protein n=1 Tax=unclassified Brevibacillus TaxID=2684853 RepID=UPI0039A03B87
MGKTVTYYRSSTDLQEHSIDVQRNKEINYCLKNMLFIDHEYEDPHVSARKVPLEQRTDAYKLYQEIERGNIENLVLYKRDRLVRNVEEYLRFYYALKEKNVKVHFTADNESPLQYGAVGDFLEVIFAGIIQHEGSQINSRILDSKIALFEEGKYGGNLPYGYKKGQKKNEIVKVDSELKVVRLIYDEFLSGRHASLNDLNKYITDLNIKKRGKEWKTAEIEKVLLQPLYMGTRVMKFEGVPHFHEMDELSIVDRDEWEQAHELLSKLKPPKEAKEKEKIDYPLDEVLKCGYCHRSLEGIERMRSGQYIPFYECKQHNHRIKKADVEEIVFRKSKEYFLALLTTQLPELFERYVDHNQQLLIGMIKKQDTVIEQAEQQLHKKMEKWLSEKNMDKKERKKNELFELENELHLHVARKEELYSELQTVTRLPDVAEKTKADFVFDLDDLDVRTVKQLIGDVVDRVLVTRYSLKVFFKHPFTRIHEVVQCDFE